MQGSVLPWLSKRYPDASLIVFGSLMLGTNLLGTNFLLLIPGDLFLTCVATGFLHLETDLYGLLSSLLSKIAGREYQGTVQGFASSFGGFASITGLILGGLLYELLAGRAFLLADMVIYAVFLLNFRLRQFE